MRVPEVDAASDGNLFLFLVVVAFLELGFFFEKQFVGGLVLPESRNASYPTFPLPLRVSYSIQIPKTIRLKLKRCRALSSPPAPQRPCGIRAYKTPARPSWGLFHLRLASSPVSASA